MQTCSQGWKDNQLNPLVSESFLELTYEIGDPDSLADATATDNGATEFANTALTVNEIDETMVKYATFEQNLWKMDGSCKLLPDVVPYLGTGFVGNELIGVECAPVQPTFIRASVAYKQDGTQVAANEPRYEAGQFGQGVMVEEGTTNIVLYSEDFDNAAWIKTAVTLTAVTAPNGTATARQILETTNAGYHWCYQRITPLADNTDYTISFYAKIAGRDWCYLRTENKSNTPTYSWFNLATGNIGTNNHGAGKLSISSVGNGWYRITATANSGTGTGGYNPILIGCATGDGVASYPGDVTKGICVWGAQLETKSYPTSYYQTTNAQAARTAETLMIPTAGVLSTTEGTVEFWFYVPSVSNAAYIYIFDHNPGNNNNNRVLIYGDLFNGLMALVGDGTKFILTAYIKCQIGWNYICLRYGSFGVKFTVNSTTLTDATISHLSTLLAQYTSLGSFSGGAYQAQGALYDDFRLSSKARTDAEILAAYQSNAPLPVDEYTTYKLNFDGKFPTNPLVTVSFSQVYTKIIPGVTIKWGEVYGDYASDFIVTAYNGATVVATQTVTGNANIISQVLLDITNYNKITVEITKWANPNRRARIEEIFVGIKKVYSKSDVLDYKHSQSVDLLSFKLPKAQISFDINNLDGEYNPFNLSGNAKYLIERQRILVKYGYKVNNAMEWIKAGGFYLSEWTTPQNGIKASFVARDLLEFMGAQYSGTISNITLYDLAISALTQANLPLNRDGSVKWIVNISLQLITVSATLVEKTTIAEVLQLVANAGCCVIYQDRNEKLHIEPLSSTLTDYVIDQKNSYANAELELSKKLKSVDVNKGAAIVTNETDGEVQNVKNDLIPSTQATTVGTWVKDTLKNRMILEGDYRADPRLDALDKITVVNKYASSTIIVTDIEYTYSGAFGGKYEGRVMA